MTAGFKIKAVNTRKGYRNKQFYSPQDRKAIKMKTIFIYDVDLHFENVWDTYTVGASCIDNARYTAIKRAINELGRDYANTIDCVRVYKNGTDKLLKEYLN